MGTSQERSDGVDGKNDSWGVKKINAESDTEREREMEKERGRCPSPSIGERSGLLKCRDWIQEQGWLTLTHGSRRDADYLGTCASR